MPYRTLPPRRVFRVSVVTAYVFAPLTLLLLAAWLVGWVDHDEAATVVMLFTLFLTLAITAVAVAGMAAAYSAVHAAFAAGFQSGQASVDPTGPDPLPRLRRRRAQGECDPLLTLVE